jgi:tetratricopeptide (TPR) repeat protein
MWSAYLGLASTDRKDAMRRHLESGCSPCHQEIFGMLGELLGEAPEAVEVPETIFAPEVEGEDAYDAAISRALEGALLKLELRSKEQQKLPEALEMLGQKGPLTFGREAPSRLRGPAGVEALLQKSWEARFENPQEMVLEAGLASTWAQGLDPRQYGTGFVEELRCRALVELGNAYRVADELDMAQKTLDQADRVMVDGLKDGLEMDEQLALRLCDIQASLHADRRLFAESCEALDAIHMIHLQRGDRHLAGRALISKGAHKTSQGNTGEAEQLILHGLEMIDAEREPALVLVSLHNLLSLMVDRGELRDAQAILCRNRTQLSEAAGRINVLKLQAMEGRIAAGLGDLAVAEKIFRQVTQAFQAENLSYKAALSSLELAVVLREMGRDDEAQAAILEAVEVFLRLGVDRVAIAAMLVLRKACEAGATTPALLRATIHFLVRAEDHPRLSGEVFMK